MDQLKGTVITTVFRNPDNGYSVLTVRADGRRTSVTGVFPELSPGEQVLFTGAWTDHPTYGPQFSASSFEVSLPTVPSAIEQYLASGLIRGVGASTAARIVQHFGPDTLEILSEHPERLLEIPGIGKARLAMITESFREQQGSRRVMVALQSWGIAPALAAKIASRYGPDAIDIIRANPYRLCEDLEGVGFLTADRIGTAIGVPPDSQPRIHGALVYLLQEAAAVSGHVFLPEPELCSRAAALLRLSEDVCRSHLTALLLSRRLSAATDEDTRRIYLPRYDRAERETALRLRELMITVRRDKYAGAARDISVFEKRHGIRFSPIQRQAILQALENGVFVITGGPGTGKTTIINCILSLLSRDNKTVLCAPTGRAARRMTEATGVESQTIHRLLEYGGEDGAFRRDADNPIDADCIIADEASMIDLLLMQSLLRAVEPGTRLILVGDADQLPSVGAGNVLGDILDSGQVPHICLTDIFRQSETSRIIVNAHLINHGQMPLLNEKNTDFFFERQPSPAAAAASVAALVSSRLPRYLGFSEKDRLFQAVRSLQVLSPTRKGDCGVAALNLLLQQTLNPPRPGLPELSWGDAVFRLGDKVIHTRNDYTLAWTRSPEAGRKASGGRQAEAREDNSPEEGAGVFNGDIGYIVHVDPEGRTLTVRFDDERDVIYETAILDHLELAYCLSVHKSQGSEFPAVILPVVSGPPLLMTRNLLYTALTRARSLVVLVGQEDTIRRMVENDHVIRRNTALALRLRETEAYL